MTNFENLKNEIDIHDFANRRVPFNSSFDTVIHTDVKDYDVPMSLSETEKNKIYVKAFHDELKWLGQEVKEGNK